MLISAEISDLPLKVNRITTNGNKNKFKEFATVICVILTNFGFVLLSFLKLESRAIDLT